MSEEWTNPYNVFNSMKMLVHVPTWRRIYNGECIYPSFVALDPCGKCDLHCQWCNSAPAMTGNVWDKSDIDLVMETLIKWGTKAVCIGGGGESCLCDDYGHLIRRLHAANIKIGIVTNGVRIRRHMDCLSLVDWIGISVDAASPETYKMVKGIDKLDVVCDNIRELVNLKGPHVEFKFLICPTNCYEIYNAAVLAKNLGCNSYHCRPGQTPWHALGTGWMHYDPYQLKSIYMQSEQALALTGIQVACVTHKYDPTFKPVRLWSRCWACLTHCYISPSLDVGLCVCRRGDPAVIMGNLRDDGLIWLSDRHRDMVAGFDVSKCPQCSSSHINEIWEHMVLKDDMGSDFY